MCNLSTGLIERAEARGEARGEAKGEARGIAKGEAKGEARGVAKGEAQTWVTSARNLMKNLKLSAQQAVDAISVPAKKNPRHPHLTDFLPRDGEKYRHPL